MTISRRLCVTSRRLCELAGGYVTVIRRLCEGNKNYVVGRLSWLRQKKTTTTKNIAAGFFLVLLLLESVSPPKLHFSSFSQNSFCGRGRGSAPAH